MARDSDSSSTEFLKVVAQTSHGPESLWVEPLDEGRFRLESVPLLAYGMSLNDVVSVNLVDGVPQIEDVLERSGHSTFRLMVADEHAGKSFEARFRKLAEFGCAYEGISPTFLAVDVPLSAPLAVVYDLLERGEKEGIWRFEEGHVARSD